MPFIDPVPGLTQAEFYALLVPSIVAACGAIVACLTALAGYLSAAQGKKLAETAAIKATEAREVSRQTHDQVIDQGKETVRTTAKIGELELQINHKMDLLIKTISEAAFAKGEKEGKEAQIAATAAAAAAMAVVVAAAPPAIIVPPASVGPPPGPGQTFTATVIDPPGGEITIRQERPS